MTREAIRAQDLRPALPDLAVISTEASSTKKTVHPGYRTLFLLSEYGVPTVVKLWPYE